MHIFVAGTFDAFHVGHQYFLWTAYHLATHLHITVARDETVLRIKKKYPRNNENLRLKRVLKEFKKFQELTERKEFQESKKAQKFQAIMIPKVSVLLGRKDADFFKQLESVNPDLIFLGYDQNFDQKKILATCNSKQKEWFQKIEIKKSKPYHPRFFKSSKFFLPQI